MTILALSNGEWISIAAIAVIVIGALFTLIYKTGSLVRLVEEMKPHVGKIPGIEVKVEELWRNRTTVSNSPSRLNEYGEKILINSKIDKLLEPFYEEIVKIVKDSNPSNAYKVQETLINVLEKFKNKEELQDKLETAAFSAGTEVSTILFVAAIHMRDDLIAKFGFNIEEIDLHDPKNNKEK